MKPSFKESARARGEIEVSSCASYASDSEIDVWDYPHLLGQDLHAELIKHGFLSETEEVESFSDGKVTSLDESLSEEGESLSEEVESSLKEELKYLMINDFMLQARLLGFLEDDFGFCTNSIQDLPDHKSNSESSSICDAKANQQKLEVELDEDLPDYKSNSESSSICDVKANQQRLEVESDEDIEVESDELEVEPDEDIEVEPDEDWEKLKEDFSDEDWLIV
ncbi:uncharacterized protein LOC130991219 [Salvia miltiorrhiza]|uniref:uncharacterized protein LOC130991219 n=1 Tax=Salvia miltiorrhiza TaxID=226208 RepID=UPI0025ABCD75|nr:uncharacterized protein LOC130991219 [Salvia miltiorrhiza]XP_057771306.1 uncharacterized protein LOC130991219 [Salvia miltiorrhiza]XP_057771307.1 uncharacterized protein LOC130991219 [Salvia miltiorrhiza]